MASFKLSFFCPIWLLSSDKEIIVIGEINKNEKEGRISDEPNTWEV